MTEKFPIAERVATVTAAQMAEVDRIARADLGIALEALMENAAHQIARVARSWLGDVRGRDVVALAGSGHNGGDALATIRWLRGWGAGVRAVCTGPGDRMRPLARRQRDTLAALGVEVIDAAAEPSSARDAIARCDLLLDGLLGYSATGGPRGAVAELIGLTADARATVVAVDLPSGIDADTGEAPATAIRADITVTLALPKPGLLVSGARQRVGTLFLADIGIPSAAFAKFGVDTTGLFSSSDIVRVER